MVTRPNARMEFRPWTPSVRMVKDRYGIPIPSLPANAPVSIVPDVMLIPVVAFDEAGFRLGYGGGYFDRTLAELTPAPFTIGVGFEISRLDTVFPEPHDIPLAAIVTETGIHGPYSRVPSSV